MIEIVKYSKFYDETDAAMVAIQYCVVVYDVVAPFELETRRWEAGGRDIVVEADGSAAPGPDVEQRDVIPPVPPGAAQGNELLVLEDETDLKTQMRSIRLLLWHLGGPIPGMSAR